MYCEVFAHEVFHHSSSSHGNFEDQIQLRILLYDLSGLFFSVQVFRHYTKPYVNSNVLIISLEIKPLNKKWEIWPGPMDLQTH